MAGLGLWPAPVGFVLASELAIEFAPEFRDRPAKLFRPPVDVFELSDFDFEETLVKRFEFVAFWQFCD